MTLAFGKVILVGEHAVVHGHAALAAAIDRGVKVSFEGKPHGPITLTVGHWNLAVAAGDEHPLARALDLLSREVGADHLSLDLHALAELPPAAGLGSSAAFMVALTRTLSSAAGRPLDDARLLQIASAGEQIFHGTPSGIDVTLAAQGGIGIYRRATGLVRLDATPLTLAVGLTGEPRRTADMVARVSQALERDGGTRVALDELGRAAEEGARGLVAGDLAPLVAGMNRAQEVLAGFGLSTRGIESLCETALRHGALAAKLTGAGGGGAVIALGPGREHEIVSAWRALGRDAFVVRAG